ncbi:MAG: methyltransferase [Syntrophobacteraceae bacterium]|nr:methyltransferase [Syntrophobacteraceae bacterium]
MATARGFMKSRIILTAAELDLFTLIDDSYDSAEKIAQKSGWDQRALERLMDCLVTFGLLHKNGKTYALTDQSAAYSSKKPDSALPMLLHMRRLWQTWSALTEVIKLGPDSESKPPVPMDMDDRHAFIGAMHAIGRNLSEEIAASIDLGGRRKMLDIGGGSGTYTLAFLKRNPELRAVLFDLADVIPMARERLSSEGVLERAELYAGDFYSDELPEGCDLALLSAIIHQSGYEQNVELFGKIYRALDPGGLLLIRDHIMNEDRTWPAQGALFAINMLVNTRSGDTYTFEEVEQGLLEAGFTDVSLLRCGERMDCVVGAAKPL